MKHFCIALLVSICSLTATSQSTIHWDSIPSTLSITDDVLLQISIAKQGDTIALFPQKNGMMLGVVQIHQVMNHAVTNVRISIIDISNASLFLSIRKGVEKGKGFIGRITQKNASDLYLLQYHESKGYYFERKIKSTFITP